MYIYQGYKGAGKTSTCVDWVKAGVNRAIVVINHQEGDRIIREYGLSPQQVYVWGSNTPRIRGFEVAIDNLDLILQQVYGDVKIATVTKES